MRRCQIKVNPPRKTAIVWWVITVLALFGIFAPHLFGMSGIDGGFAISFFCLIISITGLIVAILYTRRASKLDTMLRGQNLLVRWTYSSDEWKEYAESEFKEEKEGKRSLFFLIAGIALIIGILFWIFDREAGLFVFYVMLGLIILVALVALTTTWYNYRQNKKYLGEAYISTTAVYLNRSLHIWGGPGRFGARLDSVVLEERSSQQLLEFTYSAPTRQGMQEYKVHVPVPRGQEKTAREVLAKFNQHADVDGSI